MLTLSPTTRILVAVEKYARDEDLTPEQRHRKTSLDFHRASHHFTGTEALRQMRSTYRIRIRKDCCSSMKSGYFFVIVAGLILAA